MKLSYPILAVMLDGKEHTENEIVSRVKHFIKPEQAVRRYCEAVNRNRVRNRRANQTEKIVLCIRKEDLSPDTVNLADSVAFVVKEGLRSLRGNKHRNGRTIPYIECTGPGVWKLHPETKEYIKSAPMVAFNLGKAITVNLKARGELP